MVMAIKRPVVLIVVDDFLIRMDAVEMIEAAGFCRSPNSAREVAAHLRDMTGVGASD